MTISEIKKGVKRTLLAGTIAYSTLFATDILSNYALEEIKSQRELEEIVHKEATTLGMDPEIIKCELLNELAGESIYGGDLKNQYIYIGGLLANRKIVRHELYHIYDKHCDHDTKTKAELNYWFIEEPKAIIYSLTGLKL
jgi:hypothetical protein